MSKKPLSVTLPTPPHPPQGNDAWPPPWYQLVARPLGFLPLPSWAEAPLAFQAPQTHRRQAGKKVLPQTRHRFQKSRHLYILQYAKIIKAILGPRAHLK